MLKIRTTSTSTLDYHGKNHGIVTQWGDYTVLKKRQECMWDDGQVILLDWKEKSGAMCMCTCDSKGNSEKKSPHGSNKVTVACWRAGTEQKGE